MMWSARMCMTSNGYSEFLFRMSVENIANFLGARPLVQKMILTDFEMQSVRRAGTDLIEDIYPGCWAIEQYSKTKVCDEVTDVYGLCASMLFALSGTVPMDAPKRKKDPRLLISKAILKQLPEHVIPAIANGLQVDADRRTSSFSRFAAELVAERRSWSRWWRAPPN